MSLRRKFLKAGLGAGAAGAALGFPHIARAQQSFNWKMTSAYPKGAPFYMDGPGSATDLAKRIEAMSSGRLKIQVYGAGELIPAFEGFDAVRSGTVEMNHANSYFWTGKTFAAQYFCRRSLRSQLPGDERLALRRRRHGAVARGLRALRHGRLPLRQHRRADERLVPQGDQVGRRPQGPEDAHPRPRRQGLRGARRRREAAARRARSSRRSSAA